MKKKMLIALLLFLWLSSLFRGRGLTLAATLTPRHRLSQALSWARQQEGAFWDLDARHGAQCSDLVSAYMNLLCAGDPLAYVFGVYDARFYPTAARMQADKWWVLTQGDPLPGDIFVSKGGVYYGHTGIVLSPQGDTCLILDQNSASPSLLTGCAAYLHEITWEGAYERTHLIRFKGFWELTAHPALPLIEETGRNYVSLSLQPVPGTTGICLSLSEDSLFQKERRIITRRRFLTLRGLKKGKRYYMRVRSYLKVSKETYYGEYSPILSFETLS